MTALPAAPPVGSLVPDIAVVGDVATTGDAMAAEGSSGGPSAGGSTTVTIPRQTKRRRRGRTILGLLLAIAATAAAAWGTWTYLIPHRVDVPSVVGIPLDEARGRLEDAGLVPRIGQGSYSKQVSADVILAVRPAEGTTLEQGDRVTLVPSLGPPPVEVPMLLGVPLSEAKERLRGSEFRVGDVTRAYSERFGVDQVIRQSVRGGDDAPFGSAIDLVVSRGPTPVAVPRVIGATEEDATSELQALGFLVTVEDAYSQDVKRGRVISQDPGRGSQLQPGSAVTIVVSLGPEEFAMPNVVGMSRDTAVARLTELGLRVNVAIVPGQGGSLVVYQEPATGTIVQAGDVVDIFVA
jgi:serine/threonine-protein kinase